MRSTGAAETVLAFPVSDAHCADVGGVVEIVGELGIEAAFGERVGHHCCGDVGALVVHTLPRGGAERSECLSPVLSCAAARTQPSLRETAMWCCCWCSGTSAPSLSTAKLICRQSISMSAPRGVEQPP